MAEAFEGSEFREQVLGLRIEFAGLGLGIRLRV